MSIGVILLLAGLLLIFRKMSGCVIFIFLQWEGVGGSISETGCFDEGSAFG